ncbi:DUF1269 domain-containing protein [Nocardioides sp.]|uniref:DUF1269 domain-containing protein n=1 Tax=Nocardioides sp. TaxID=35761 RepID=UPI002D7FE595|nr:DUF1269 domain-containing protein [Nocardioides sp.]HET8962070.1 DUF1269 domain-containing protein [Nocardioides sp.]
MATLTVWTFTTSTGAEEASARVQDLARNGGVVVHDAATVSWDPAARKPTTGQLAATPAAESLGRPFWGLLLGHIFLIPLLGAAMGAATGAVAGPLADVGIDDIFINKVRDQITPGTSGLFVLGPDGVGDALAAELAPWNPDEPILTRLSPEQEAALRWVFLE